MILVDTGAWFAVAVAEDPDHAAAMAFLDGNRDALVTTDLVAVETMNLLRFRHRGAAGHALANRVGDDLWGGRAASLVRVQPEDIRAARVAFRRFDDKVWSFTDCTSFVVMERLGIQVAFAFDRNFEQYPGLRRVP